MPASVLSPCSFGEFSFLFLRFRELTDLVEGVSTVPLNWPTAGVVGLSLLNVTLVSRTRWPFLIGLLTSTQVALDGAMILFSMLALNVFHPGRLLQGGSVVQEKKNDSVTDV